MGFNDINLQVSGPQQPASIYKTKVLKGQVPFATQVTEPNTKYVIKHNFVLDGDVTIPENCILEFDGGSISGEHTITGQNTGIEAGLAKIFNTNVTLAGTWNIEGWHVEWFGAKGDGVTDDTAALQKCATFREGVIILGCKEYVVTDTIDASASFACWKGGFGNCTQWLNGNINTRIKYKGNQDIVVFYLPNGAENIYILGNFSYGSDRNSFIGTGFALGKGASWVANGRYRNIGAAFMKYGLHLNSSFGCVFDGIKFIYNYIGILADPEIVEGTDSGYVTLITFNSFEIADNGYAGIAKLSNTVASVMNAYFNNGYIENNGSLLDIPREIYCPTQTPFGGYQFNNVYGEGSGCLAEIYQGSLKFNNCSFRATSLIIEYGALIVLNTNAASCVFNNYVAANVSVTIDNSSLKMTSMQLRGNNNLVNALLDKESVGNTSEPDGTLFKLSTVPLCDPNKLNAYNLQTGTVMFWGNSIVYKKDNWSFGNIPNGTSDQRPNITNDNKISGFIYYDTTLQKILHHVIYKGFREYDGALPGIKRSGTTSERPVGGYMGWNLYIGFMYFDTDLGKPIYAKEINSSTGVVTWVDATGATV